MCEPSVRSGLPQLTTQTGYGSARLRRIRPLCSDLRQMNLIFVLQSGGIAQLQNLEVLEVCPLEAAPYNA